MGVSKSESLQRDVVAVLPPAPPAADAQRSEHDEQDTAQDMRDGHEEDEEVHLHAAALSGSRQASMIDQRLQKLRTRNSFDA